MITRFESPNVQFQMRYNPINLWFDGVGPKSHLRPLKVMMIDIRMMIDVVFRGPQLRTC